MLKIETVVDIMEKTEYVPFENEDFFAYYDKEKEIFLIYKTTDLHIAECKSISEESFDNIYGDKKEIKEICQINETRNGRYVYLKNPYTRSRMTKDFIDLYKKDKELYGKMNKAYGGKNKFAKLKDVLYQNKILNVYNEYINSCLKKAAVVWCCKNNIEYEH